MWWISSLLLELIIRNSYVNKYSEKLFCQAYCFIFSSSQNSFFGKHVKFENCKALKKYKWRINASLSQKFIKILNYIKYLCIFFMLNWFKYFDQRNQTIFIQQYFSTLRLKYVPGGREDCSRFSGYVLSDFLP